MNGEIPGTGRFTPAGSGGADTAARGDRTAACAMETFLRVARERPATSPMAAAATVTPAVTRKDRRSADAVTTGAPAPPRAAPARAGTGPGLPVLGATLPGPRAGPPGPRPAPGARPVLPGAGPPPARSGARSSSASSGPSGPSGRSLFTGLSASSVGLVQLPVPLDTIGGRAPGARKSRGARAPSECRGPR